MWNFVAKNKNDIIYLSLLLFSVAIGPYYRRLKTVEAKKWAGSILGLLLIIIVSGYSAAHPICSALFGITAIKVATEKRCHIVTFFFMFGYLIVFRLSDKFGLPPTSGQTNLIEMIIVLRVVGVAFEINGSHATVTKIKNLELRMAEREARLKRNEEKKKRLRDKDSMEKDIKDKDSTEGAVRERNVKGKDTEEKDVNESEVKQTDVNEKEVKEKDNLQEKKDYEFVEIIDPDFIDLFHYSFHYCGLLTGPYYRYRTFNDYFRLPFSKYVDCFGFTINTLKTVPLYISLYLAFSNIWPVEYVLTEEHNNRHFIYRMFYPWALFAAFRQRIYAGMTLAESVCTSAGLGAYPVQGRTRSGHGPTMGYLKLLEMTDEEAKKAQYDFITVESMDVWGCETVVTLRDSMKVWNKGVQYWVAMVVYKRFPIKPLKIHAALFVSVIWHGFHAGYFFCIYACPFYLMAEDIYSKLFYKYATGMQRKIVGFILWFLRSHSESYQAAAFLLLSFDRVWTYYSSVHHYWYGCWFVFLIVGIVLKKLNRYRIRIAFQAYQSMGAFDDRNRLLDNDNGNRRAGNGNEESLEGNDNVNRVEGNDNENKVEGDGNENIVEKNDKDNGVEKDDKDKSGVKDDKDKVADKDKKDKDADKDEKDKGADQDVKDKGIEKNDKDKGADKDVKDKADEKGDKDKGADKDVKDKGVEKDDKDKGADQDVKDTSIEKNDKDKDVETTDKDKSASKDDKDKGDEKNDKDKGVEKADKDEGVKKADKDECVEKADKDKEVDKDDKDDTDNGFEKVDKEDRVEEKDDKNGVEENDNGNRVDGNDNVNIEGNDNGNRVLGNDNDIRGDVANN